MSRALLNITHTVNIRAFVEGFYLRTDSMKAILNAVNFPNLFDLVTVELHSSTAPYSIFYAVADFLDIHGYGSFYFPTQTSGQSYYIVIRHRNSVATWSKYPVLFNSSNVNFDFTRP